MLVTWHPFYNHPVPENHKFPMEKYDLVKQQLLLQGIVHEKEVIHPQKLQIEHALLAHTPSYVENLLNIQIDAKLQRASGFVHDNKLIERELIIMEGTRYITEMVTLNRHKYGFNIAGGTHHAYSNKPEGFCLLNDLAIAANWALQNTPIKNVLILDLDVHQGNGTAEIMANNKNVYTLSIHCENNYPFRKEKSSLDISLQKYTNDDLYLKLLENALQELSFKPELVLYQAGVDILESDKLGHLSISQNGVKKRDSIVYNYAKKNDIPIVTTLGGGYSPNIFDIVQSHCNTFLVAKEIFNE